MQNSKKLKRAVTGLLGEAAYTEGVLNKEYVASKIFNNKTTLAKMNAIVHPVVRDHFLKWTAKQNAPYVIQESALIFENDHSANYDSIILVTAPLAQRIQRVTQRDGLQVGQVQERLENQLPDAQKLPLANHVIVNEELHQTRLRVHAVNNALLANGKYFKEF